MVNDSFNDHSRTRSDADPRPFLLGYDNLSLEDVVTTVKVRCRPAPHLQGPPVLPHMTSPACHPCYPGSPPIGFGRFR
jgi:hypothetical protein